MNTVLKPVCLPLTRILQTFQSTTSSHVASLHPQYKQEEQKTPLREPIWYLVPFRFVSIWCKPSSSNAQTKKLRTRIKDLQVNHSFLAVRELISEGYKFTGLFQSSRYRNGKRPSNINVLIFHYCLRRCSNYTESVYQTTEVLTEIQVPST
jgi:hypothetical protein